MYATVALVEYHVLVDFSGSNNCNSIRDSCRVCRSYFVVDTGLDELQLNHCCAAMFRSMLVACLLDLLIQQSEVVVEVSGTQPFKVSRTNLNISVGCRLLGTECTTWYLTLGTWYWVPRF